MAHQICIPYDFSHWESQRKSARQAIGRNCGCDIRIGVPTLSPARVTRSTINRNYSSSSIHSLPQPPLCYVSTGGRHAYLAVPQ
jgi:hypothetical protein